MLSYYQGFVRPVISTIENFFFFFCRRHFVRLYFFDSATLRKFYRRKLKITKIKFTKTFDRKQSFPLQQGYVVRAR